jgi:branched-chain amino acid transport system substrate-binding protein
MSDASERPTGTQGPLKYAPRAVRDGDLARDRAAVPATNKVPSRTEVESDADEIERLFPLRDMRAPPVPPPPPERESSPVIRNIVLPSLAAIASALLVFAFYSGKLDFSMRTTPPPAPAVPAPTPGSIADNSARVPAPRAAVESGQPVPAKIDENASRPAATAAAVAPQRPPAPSVRGVTDTEIRFGIAAPFSGPARELGRQMKLGIDAAFGMVNAAGGINGRQLRLIAADDGYEPTQTTEAMKQLFEKEKIFGIVGNVGTPTAMVALPYALEQRALFFGAFTGAGLLRRDPPDRYVFNYRASYAEETDAVVRYLVKVRRLRPEQIAVFAQQDGYGDAGYAGVEKAIRAMRGGDAGAILRLNYTRNTVDVDDAVARLIAYNKPTNKLPIRAVVMVPTYRAAAKFIEKTHDLFPGMIYTNVSFVGSTALAEELMLLGAKYAEGVMVTQVVPAISGYSSLVLEYKGALAKVSPGEKPDYVSLEGYVAAGLLAEGLKRTGSEVDTEKLVDALESLRNFDMGVGTPLSFGRTEHQGSHKVWGTVLDANGRYQAVDLQ